MDLAIINGKILTFKDNTLGIIDNGAIGVTGSKISFVGAMENFDKKDVELIIDGKNHVIMPGLVNAHTHTGLTLLRGGAQDLPEIEWMNKGLGPLARHLTFEDFVVGAKLGVLEGLKSGTTTFCEYAGDVTNLVEKVYLPFGARVVATETINEVSQKRDHLQPTELYEFDRGQGEQAFKRATDLFNKFANNALVHCMYGPQALDMISLELLQAIKNEAIENNRRIHMHIAQGGRERLQISKRFGKTASTVKVLEKYGFLDASLLAAHCHDTSEIERELLVKCGVNVVGCPSSISMIDGIVPPVNHIQALGGKVGLGTDQAPGSGLHNMFCEMRTISILTKISLKDPTVLPAWEVLQIGVKGGAKILGLESKIGTLEVGKAADIITINLNHLNLTPSVVKPFRNYIPNIIYSATGYEVDNVIINGKQIIENGLFKAINIEEITKDANKRAERIFKEGEDDWIKADSKLVTALKKGFI